MIATFVSIRLRNCDRRWGWSCKNRLCFMVILIPTSECLTIRFQDEATANVDTETEEMIQTGLDRIQENRTTIAIAHRLSTIQNADLILVLNQGQIVERGSNDELLQQHGYYYDMIQLQNSAHVD